MKRDVPRKQLLVFETGKHGYKELADFLGLSCQPETAYPRSNSTAEFGFIIILFRVLAALTVAVPCAAVWWFFLRSEGKGEGKGESEGDAATATATATATASKKDACSEDEGPLRAQPTVDPAAQGEAPRETVDSIGAVIAAGAAVALAYVAAYLCV